MGDNDTAVEKVSRRLPPQSPASPWQAVVFRLLAYVLTFAAGAAAMLVYQQARRPADDPQPVSGRHDAQEPLGQLPAPLETPSLNAGTFTAVPASVRETLDDPEASEVDAPQVVERQSFLVAGVTEPAPGRFAKLPLATGQPVAFVDVRPGDRVKKGWQVFSHWESPERLQVAKNELEKSKKLLDIAKARSVSAEQSSVRLEGLGRTVSSQELQDARSNATIRKAELEAAEITVTETENRFIAMDFEFKQAFVTSPIEGVVAAVDVLQGERRQLGGPFRGVTVLDSRVLACRCLCTPEQATELSRALPSQGSAATIEFGGEQWPAKIVSIGVLAESSTGRIPVILEVENPEELLRCGIRVQIGFPQLKTVNP